MITNRLSREKSPYLLQHRDNPVYWYAWGDEAFLAAKTEQKPIFLSIGYSTCHWCHVMAHESFEDQAVADVLNKNFISIKVDREERPDVDKIYMDAVTAMTGQGGWPMSVFLTSDLKPFFGGTYYTKEQFIYLLEQVHQGWTREHQKIIETGEALTKHLKEETDRFSGKKELDEVLLTLGYNHRKATFDEIHGGFGGAPKFPPSPALMFLLRYGQRTGEKKALEMVAVTLDHMARGGIYDHLGGGFSRYATDHKWLIPHFEKMLYDNAQLAWVYLEAYQWLKKPMYVSVARETLNYVLRRLMHSEGGFYSAEDADSEGEEGKFYVWTQAELSHLLTPDECNFFKDVYGVTPTGNFEHKTNVLNLQPKYDWKIKEDPLLISAHQKLFQAREKRVHPHRDEKIIVAWNGLMISAMAKAYQVLKEETFLSAAIRAASLVESKLFRNQLLRRYCSGEAGIDGCLDDYAYFIQSLLMLYECNFDKKWLIQAEQIQKIQDEQFWDEKGGYFYSAATVPYLIRRTKEFYDHAEPNPNGVSALNLLKLSQYTTKLEYKVRSKQTLLCHAEALSHYPGGYAQMQIALDSYLSHPQQG